MRQTGHVRCRRLALASAALLLLLGARTTLNAAPGDAYRYSIISLTRTAVGDYPLVTFAVENPLTGAKYDLQKDPAWTQTASGSSRLFLQIAWDTTDITNTDSGSNSVPGGKGAAMPIPVDALAGSVLANGDGTYTAASPLPVPAAATGTWVVGMEGHPAAKDPATGQWTVRVPVKSAYKYFAITGSRVERRTVVDVGKCMNCHRSDGTGVAPQLTLHGNNRTEEPQVCVLCHNPNNTDIPYRLSTDPRAIVGPYSYPEESLDFKRLVHGIHASAKGFRQNPLVVIGFRHTVFDASTLKEYPTDLKNCAKCHVDNGTKGTYELPLGSNVLGTTYATKSTFATDGSSVVNAAPKDDVKISPTAAVCSSCHDERQVIAHMVQTGGASFSTSQAALDRGSVRERCAACHGPGKEKSVRKVHGLGG